MMKDFKKQLLEIDKKLAIPRIHNQVTEIESILKYLDKKEVLPRAPESLGLKPDEFDELLYQIDLQNIPNLRRIDNLLNNFRSYVSRTYGIWSLANLRTAEEIKKLYHVNTSLEVMGGNSYWSEALNKVGIKAISTDSMSWAKASKTGSQSFYKTQKMNAKNAIRKYSSVDLILCCWAPNFGTGDVEILNSFRKYCNSRTRLLFIGEKGGATNSEEFWKKAKIVHGLEIKQLNRTFPNFDFINEKFYEIK